MNQEKVIIKKRMTLKQLWNYRYFIPNKDYPRGDVFCQIMHRFDKSCNICPLWSKNTINNMHCLVTNNIFDSREEAEKFLLKLMPSLLFEKSE